MKTTRRTLYEEVWSAAMTTLARKYGLSDVGLAKICKKHDIPKPWPGYWARRYAGQKINRTPLPNPKHDPEITIEDRLPDATAARRRANTVKPVVAVTETLRGAHPLVRATRNILASRKPDSNGLVTCKEPGYLSACVSPASVQRAMLIINSLIKALESKHYIVKPCGETTETVVEIEGQRITLMIDEHLEKVEHEMPVDALTGPYTFHHSRRAQRQEPNGRLRIQIEPCEWLGRIGLRRTWNDGKTVRIERLLGDVVESMVGHAEALTEKQQREEIRQREREAEEARRREAARRLNELKAAIERETARVTALKRKASDWAASRQLREYIAAVKAAGERDGKPCTPGSELGDWIVWATAQADRLDPLRESPPSVLDRANEIVERSVWSRQ